jgi:hypothetical protein
MSRPLPSPLAARLRRQLLAQGLTAEPVCPACGEQTPPKDFTRDGICQPCAAERLAVSDKWDEEQASAVWEARYGDLGLPREG